MSLLPAVLGLLFVGSAFSGPLQERCQSLTKQSVVDLNMVSRDWYVVEVVSHKVVQERSRPRGTRVKSSVCPTLSISVTEHPGEHTHTLVIRWTEDSGTVDYFFLANNNTTGLWTSHGPQNATLRGYQPFAGTVYVAKAVMSHMVLTWCSPNTELYSLVLARERASLHEMLDGVHQRLEDWSLPLEEVKETCRGAASLLRVTILLPFLVLLPFLSVPSH